MHLTTADFFYRALSSRLLSISFNLQPFYINQYPFKEVYLSKYNSLVICPSVTDVNEKMWGCCCNGGPRDGRGYKRASGETTYMYGIAGLGEGSAAWRSAYVILRARGFAVPNSIINDIDRRRDDGRNFSLGESDDLIQGTIDVDIHMM